VARSGYTCSVVPARMVGPEHPRQSGGRDPVKHGQSLAVNTIGAARTHDRRMPACRARTKRHPAPGLRRAFAEHGSDWRPAALASEITALCRRLPSWTVPRHSAGASGVRLTDDGTADGHQGVTGRGAASRFDGPGAHRIRRRQRPSARLPGDMHRANFLDAP